MFIKRVKLENFGNVKNEELFFNEGITVFSGENGEGKSTILRAISMGLYNRFPLTLKDYIRWGEESFSIEIDFDHAGNDYEFEMSHSGGTKRELRCLNTEEVWVNTSAVEQLDALLDVKRAVASTISFEHEIDLITTLPSERREYLKGIYDLNFRTQLATIEKHLEDTQNKVDVTRGELISLEAQEFELLVLDRLPFSEDKLELYKERRESLQKELNLYEEKRKNLDELVNSSDSKDYQLFRKTKQREEEEKELASIKEQEQRAKEALENFPKEFDLTPIEESYKQKSSDIERDLLEAEGDLARLVKEQEEKKTIQSGIEFDEAILKRISERRVGLQLQYERAKEDLQLFEQGICPTCKQTIDPSDISSWEADKQKAREDLEVIKKEEEEALKNKRDFQDISDSLSLISSQISRTESTISILESKKQHLAEEKEKEIGHAKERHELQREKLEMNCESFKTQVQGKISLITSFEEEEKTLNEEIATLKKKIKEAEPVSAEEVKEKEIDLSEVKASIKFYEDTVLANKERKEMNARTTKAREERDQKVVEKKKEIDQLEEDNSKYLLAKKIYSREFPAYVLSLLVRGLEISVNEFLSRVYPQYDIAIEESKNALKITYGENRSDVRLASGFEKQIFSFAYKYALGRIQDYEILFLDEVDSAASVTNSRKFYETIGRMENSFKQLFVITHKEEIKELLSNDYKASVYQVQGGTYSLM